MTPAIPSMLIPSHNPGKFERPVWVAWIVGATMMLPTSTGVPHGRAGRQGRLRPRHPAAFREALLCMPRREKTGGRAAARRANRGTGRRRDRTRHRARQERRELVSGGSCGDDRRRFAHAAARQSRCRMLKSRSLKRGSTRARHGRNRIKPPRTTRASTGRLRRQFGQPFLRLKTLLGGATTSTASSSRDSMRKVSRPLLLPTRQRSCGGSAWT